ncbi:MAG: tRNA (N6-threonylcarbamoyladenosine(37)-N6)-methyltransferase TrmO [Methanothermobacter sp.]|nr:tRNA (N6-threonylcarbamoyladenosine(37)-N6)-methyltransferase TrmO [Methanothermobacter sp.]
MKIVLKPVGVVRSPYRDVSEAPSQGIYAKEDSVIHIFPEFQEALDGIIKYKHLFILYWLDRAERDILKVIPRGGVKERGVFSTRAPSRPNPIGLCLVELKKVDDSNLIVRGLDAVDGSYVIDIKPYFKDIDSP